MGAPGKSARVAFGALIIKETLKVSDEETVEQIQENPYLQYFLGYDSYTDEKPFDASMMVHFRKRISKQMIAEINDIVLEKQIKKSKKNKNDNDNDPCNGTDSNNGKLLLDASCAPSDISYPTDLKLLNEGREKSEKIIDRLHEPFRGKKKKVRTYRKNARRDYLRASKKRKLSKKALRKAKGKQLRYLRRDLKHIEELTKTSDLGLLSKKEYKDLLVINELYRQQKEMYDGRRNHIEGRIVNISQPHIRPIVRGKAGKSTEFGAKISISLVDGFTYLDYLNWDNYNESMIFKYHIENYKRRYGCYPEVVYVDKIYRTRENREYCKNLGIKILGKPLGRRRKNDKEYKKLKEGDRNPIEGKLGQGKRKYSLDKIMGKLPETSESMIGMVFLIMNIDKLVKLIYFCLIKLCKIICKERLLLRV
jgi:hypothetical protein